jgi:probable AcnD-accessory protein PrpF
MDSYANLKSEKDIAVTQKKISAVYMRGGTSKGLFFRPDALPSDPRIRDQVLLRAIGSPDPYGRQIDGMGAATSSTSKVVIVGPTSREGYDVDYWFGQVSIDQPLVDWSGNCGNLTSAVGPFAIAQGLVDAPRNGFAKVRIWQANIKAGITAYVPMENGEVVEDGDFQFDGVTFPAAEIKLEFLDPCQQISGGGAPMFPTGNPLDRLDVPGVGVVDVTMLNAGNAAVFIDAAVLGLEGSEMPQDINNDSDVLRKSELIRAHAAVQMGLSASADEATRLRQHTPKLAFIGRPRSYTAADGKPVDAGTIDMNARIFSMGKLHHAMTGTGAVAIAAAAVIPNTVVNTLVGSRADRVIRFGHPSGSLAVGATVEMQNESWVVTKVAMSRTARRLMEGSIFVPLAFFC